MSNHQQPAADAAQISGYEYRGQLYCSSDIIAQLPTGENQEFDGWSLAPGVVMSAEDNLQEIAYAFQVDRSSVDSSEFPRRITAAQMQEDSYCASCGAELDTAEELAAVRIVFRFETTHYSNHPVTAVFADGEPREREFRSIYNHEGQHSSCTRGWYESNTRAATEEEYAELLAEMQAIGYAVTVVSRVNWSK